MERWPSTSDSQYHTDGHVLISLTEIPNPVSPTVTAHCRNDSGMPPYHVPPTEVAESTVRTDLQNALPIA